METVGARVISTLDRYLLREFIKAFLFAAVAFAIVIALGHLFDRLDVFVKNNLSATLIAKYLITMEPLWLVQVLPICTLIAGVTVVSELNRRGELLSLLMGGISLRRIYAPVFLAGLFLVIFTFVSGDTLMPLSTRYARTLYRKHVDQIGDQKQAWKDVVVIASGRRRISIKLLDLAQDRMDTVTIEDYGSGFHLRQTLSSKYAQWAPETGWVFYDGVIRIFSTRGDEILHENTFAKAQLDLVEKPSDLVPLLIAPEELSSFALKRYIQKMQGLGIPALHETVQYHFKFAFPFTHLLVLALGLPIALWTTPTGGGRGKKGFSRILSLGVAMLVTLVYYLIVTLGVALGESRRLPPEISVWLGNIIFFFIAVYLLRKQQV